MRNVDFTRREVLAFSIIGWPWPFGRRTFDIAGIKFRVIRHDPGVRRYIWIHGDESTARQVLTSHMEGSSGSAYLIESTDRYVNISGGKIDPNRMFSRVGAEKSLRALNPSWTQEQIDRTLRRLDGDRDKFLRRILPSRGELMVALHNNGPNYSINDEIPISDAVALNAPDNPDEFMLCTTKPDYEALGGGPFNVVLQKKAPTEDDGSLSRFCAARNIRYVNVEAAHGNAAAQKQMLNWVEAVLL